MWVTPSAFGRDKCCQHSALGFLVVMPRVPATGPAVRGYAYRWNPGGTRVHWDRDSLGIQRCNTHPTTPPGPTHSTPAPLWIFASTLQQDNVEPLLRLADKYDMAVVRGHCAHYLSLNTFFMGLGEPLDSPKNTLRAASLVDSLASKPELLPYRTGVLNSLQFQLWPITTASCAKKAVPVKGQKDLGTEQLQAVRGHLERWLGDARYKTLITADVQVRVYGTVGVQLRDKLCSCSTQTV